MASPPSLVHCIQGHEFRKPKAGSWMDPLRWENGIVMLFDNGDDDAAMQEL